MAAVIAEPSRVGHFYFSSQLAFNIVGTVFMFSHYFTVHRTVPPNSTEKPICSVVPYI